jgi:putative ABC transport system substrate-binding protein
MDRRTFAGCVAGSFVLLRPGLAGAQPREKVARVGFLASSPRETMQGVLATMGERMRELRYVEGHNLVIDYRYAETQEGFQARAAELVAAGSQVIFAQGPYALRGARAASATVPIVGMDMETDPVGAGYAASLARPGGNVTGVFLDQPDVSGKQLQLLRELVAGLTRVAVLYDAPVASLQLESVERAAKKLGVTIVPIVWRGPETLPAALASAKQDGARGLIVLSSTSIINPRDRPLVAAAAMKARLPAIGLTRLFARDGFLVSYGPVQRDMYRSAAALVAKILDGASPGGVPIERPIAFETVINPATAKALAITIPPSLRHAELIQ